MERRELTAAILRYLVKHPDTGDSIEGIARWRLLQDKIDATVDQVSEIVQELSTRGMVVEKEIPGGTRIYYLNKVKIQAVRKLLNELAG